MPFQPILALIIVRYLHSSLKKTGLLSKWERYFKLATVFCITLIVLGAISGPSRTMVTWIGNATLAGLVYFIFIQKDFQIVKQVIYAVLPLIIIYIIEDLVKLISLNFYIKSHSYFNSAETFGFIWMGAMLIINSRQRKALLKEQLKNEEKEKELKITETLKAALEVQVKERTLELTLQKEALQQTLNELKSTQSQLIQSEKMASLGELTAGIAHEIQNPLNFVNNFSEVNTELIEELNEEIDKGNFELAKVIANDIKENEEKINHHGKRADGIVKGMLQHSRSSNGVKEPTDINALADEYLRLAYHGLRAKDKSFNATMKTDFDESIPKINIISQDIGRVILNLITNAFYAVNEKKKQSPEGYEPVVTVSTKKENDTILITVKDNGNGIPEKVTDKIFQPFFTTKPAGEGTGLGLSLSYDIIKAHGGELFVKNSSENMETKENEGAEFTILLPG